MLRIASVLIFLAIAALLVYRFAPGLSPAELRAFVHSFGALAPIVFIIIVALKPILFFIPSLGLTVIAGTMFGPFYGTIYVSIGAAGSTAVAFYFARILGRRGVERVVSGSKKLLNFDNNMEQNGFRTVFFMRLFNIPWDLVSYSAGLSKMPFRDFYLSSMILIIPICFIYTYFGSTVEEPLSPGFIISCAVLIGLGSMPFIFKALKKKNQGNLGM